MAGSAMAAASPACKKGCDNTYQACQKAGKDYSTCMKSWGTCKRKCDPAKAMVSTAPKPAPTATVQKASAPAKK
jgi:hypothetical protein